MSALPHLKSIPENEREWFQALIDLARYLRTPEGCPWDREQSAEKFAGFLVDETAELLEAFGTNDTHLEEEYGDCLFTLLASAATAEACPSYTARARSAAEPQPPRAMTGMDTASATRRMSSMS